MMHYIFLALQAAAWGFVFYDSLQHVNRHDKSTAWVIRAAYVALAVAGGSGLVSCFWKQDVFDCVAAVGVALFLVANRKALNAEPGPTA